MMQKPEVFLSVGLASVDGAKEEESRSAAKNRQLEVELSLGPRNLREPRGI